MRSFKPQEIPALCKPRPGTSLGSPVMLATAKPCVLVTQPPVSNKVFITRKPGKLASGNREVDFVRFEPPHAKPKWVVYRSSSGDLHRRRYDDVIARIAA